MFNLKTGQIRKMPTSKEWAKVLKGIPVEDTHMDKSGHYGHKLAPHFDKWMRNG